MKNLFKKIIEKISNKKAMTDELEWTMVKLFLLSLIILIVFTGIMKVQDNSIHLLNSKSRDLAFTYSAASLTEGNLYLKYNIPSNFTASISGDCKINLVEPVKKIPSIYFCNGYKNNLNLIKETEKVQDTLGNPKEINFYAITNIENIK